MSLSSRRAMRCKISPSAGRDGSGRDDGVADAKVMEHLPQGSLQGGATLPEGFAQGGIVAGLHEEDEPRGGQRPLIHGGAVHERY